MLISILRRFVHSNILRGCLRGICTSGRLASDELVNHRDTNDNNAKTPFEFTDDNICRIRALVRHNYPIGAERSVLGPALDIVQRQIGWIPIAAMNKVADILQMPRIRVYEWATFYTMNKRYYRGKYHLKICHTTPCMLRGADMLLDCAEQLLQCKVGELTSDGVFGLDIIQCAGACVNAPVVVVDDDYYEDMTIPDLQHVINCLRCGGIPRAGPQWGRFACEPIGQMTSLIQPPPTPGFKLNPALVKPKT